MTDRIAFLGFSEPISSFTHLISALIFFIIGCKMIYQGRGNLARTTSLFVYIFCCVFLFSMSGVYHILEKGTTSNYVLQVLDYAGIYLMISGTFTPFQIILLRGYKRWLPLISIWILAITGLTLTSVFFESMPEYLHLIFFIGMGWLSLFTVWFIRSVDLTTVKFIFLGGLLYTFGAIVDFSRVPVLISGVLEAHEVFHVFVSLAALSHLYAINRISQRPISDDLTVIVKKTPKLLKAYFTSEKGYFRVSSDQEVRETISIWIQENYLPALKPRKVRIKYFKEDRLQDF